MGFHYPGGHDDTQSILKLETINRPYLEPAHLAFPGFQRRVCGVSSTNNVSTQNLTRRIGFLQFSKPAPMF